MMSDVRLTAEDVEEAFGRKLDYNEVAVDLSEDYGLVLKSVNFPQITTMVLSPDNKYLVTGSSNSQINVWDFPVCRVLLSLYGHCESITSLCLSSDSRVLFSSSADLTLCRWDYLENTEAVLLYTGTEIITKVELVDVKNLIICCTVKGNLILFSLTDHCVQGVIKAHGEWIGCLLVIEQADKIFTGSQDAKIKVWDFNCEKISEICCKAGITCIESADNREIVAFGSYDSSVSMISVENGMLIKQFYNGTRGIIAIKYLSGSYIAVASLDGFVKIWDWDKLTEIKTWNNFNCRVNQFITQNNEHLFGLCSTGEILCVKLAGFEQIYKTKVFDSGFEQGVISENGFLIVCYRKDEVGLFNLTSKKSEVFNGHTQELTSYIIIPSHDYLITGSADKTVKVWKISEKIQKASMKKHDKPIYKILVSEPAQKIISFSDDCICIWDLNGFSLKFFIKTYKSSQDYINFSEDLSFLIYFSHRLRKDIKLISLNFEPVQYLIPIKFKSIDTISINSSKNYLAISTKNSIHTISLKKLLTN